jgi:UDP-glucose 4-epimerase
MNKIARPRCLVTGGAGFIGSHLVDALVPSHNVVVLDDLSSGKLENIQHHVQSGGVEFIKGDVCDHKCVADAMHGCDVVFHLAVQCLRVSLSNPRLVHDVNATGTLNVCLASLEKKVKRLVYVSSSEVYGSSVIAPMSEAHPLLPTTPYGASKLAGEMYALTFHRTYGLPATVVRPFNTYGPRAHFEGAYGEVIPKFILRALNNLPPVVFGDGLQTRDFTYVTDTVHGLMLAASADALVGDVVNIAYGREISVADIADAILQLTGRPELRPVFTAERPADVRRHYASIVKAQGLLGFQPRIAVRQGLEKYIDWFTTTINPERALQFESERNWSELTVDAV